METRESRHGKIRRGASRAHLVMETQIWNEVRIAAELTEQSPSKLVEAVLLDFLMRGEFLGISKHYYAAKEAGYL